MSRNRGNGLTPRSRERDVCSNPQALPQPDGSARQGHSTNLSRGFDTGGLVDASMEARALENEKRRAARAAIPMGTEERPPEHLAQDAAKPARPTAEASPRPQPSRPERTAWKIEPCT